MRKIKGFFKKNISILLLVVLLSTICSTFASAQEGDHSIYNAINAGLISAEFISTGSASGHIADLVVTSAYDAISLDLAASDLNGMVLVNSDENEQDEVVVDTPGISTGPGDTTYIPTDNVMLNSGDSVTIPVIGYCINYDKSNPTNGTTFSLSSVSDKTDITQISSVLEVISLYITGENSFAQDFTPEETFSIFQIAIWASQSENAAVTLENYASRGYTLDDTHIEGIRDIFNQSGIDYTNIVALSGKKKEEPDEPSEPATTSDDETPYLLYAAVGLIAVIVIGAGAYAVKSKTTKPATVTPGETESHITSYSTPSTDGTSAKACGKSCTANCDLQCEGQCIALCERGVKGWDPNKKRGVPCKKACMSGCTFKCTTSCTSDCESWTQ